jgi:hypothetical protein
MERRTDACVRGAPARELTEIHFCMPPALSQREGRFVSPPHPRSTSHSGAGHMSTTIDQERANAWNPGDSRRPGKRPPGTNARAVPIYATTSYVFDSPSTPRVCSASAVRKHLHRIMNPTTEPRAAHRRSRGRGGGRDGERQARRPGASILRRRRFDCLIFVAVWRDIHLRHARAARNHDALRGRKRSVVVRGRDR